MYVWRSYDLSQKRVVGVLFVAYVIHQLYIIVSKRYFLIKMWTVGVLLEFHLGFRILKMRLM